MELLAPVRDEVSFTAALQGGADAVYFGLGELNMRLSSRGIAVEDLGRIVKRAHAAGVRAYVALNTLVYDEEMELLERLVSQCAAAGVDAVICSDLAAIEAARALKLEVHVSTQANISNSRAAKIYQRLGAKRVVLARELTLEQIAEVKRNTALEVEVFAHGAMCVSVSGRCYLSQFLCGRSANRGDCIQPCRRRYEVRDVETGDTLEVGDGYVMSPKDLCTLAILDQMAAAGVDVLKIEGRSRAPEYVRAVVGAYRRALDALAAGTYGQTLVEELLAEVEKVYHRGFSTGFLMGRPGPEDWTDAHGNQATQQKEYVGKVLNYYRQQQVVHARLVGRPLAVGDRVQIEGPTSGVVEAKVGELRTDEAGTIERTEQRGEVTFPCATLVRRNDQIYRIFAVERDG